MGIGLEDKAADSMLSAVGRAGQKQSAACFYYTSAGRVARSQGGILPDELTTGLDTAAAVQIHPAGEVAAWKCLS